MDGLIQIKCGPSSRKCKLIVLFTIYVCASHKPLPLAKGNFEGSGQGQGFGGLKGARVLSTWRILARYIYVSCARLGFWLGSGKGWFKVVKVNTARIAKSERYPVKQLCEQNLLWWRENRSDIV